MDSVCCGKHFPGGVIQAQHLSDYAFCTCHSGIVGMVYVQLREHFRSIVGSCACIRGQGNQRVVEIKFKHCYNAFLLLCEKLN